MVKIKIQFKQPLDDWFPMITCGCYIPELKTAFIYCKSRHRQKDFIKEIEKTISHETLHILLHELIGEDTTMKLDSISSKIYEWDKTTYYMLY